MDCNGKMYSVGDDKKEVAIESISKLFTFSKAVHKLGQKEVMKKIGAHGSSLPFNSVIAEELSPSHTINPFVNQMNLPKFRCIWNPEECYPPLEGLQ